MLLEDFRFCDFNLGGLMVAYDVKEDSESR